MKSLFSAISFLTIFPASTPRTGDMEHLKFSWIWFPLVGLLVGAVIGTVFEIAYLYLHLTKLVSATLTITASILITRGFHYDGLADTVDGLFGGSNKEERLRIMKDSHIGSFATLALICTILLQIQFTAN
ncbi:MAG: adenosylcobinamide-GDP ribazoletransferase, partial [Candidatus Paceibacterota bacterium]